MRRRATVDPEGEVLGTAPGRVLIVVQNGGRESGIVLTVRPADDRDGDQIPDAYELANGLDPSDGGDAESDADRDGLTTVQEFRHGTDPRRADTDGDGLLDGAELGAGTDPLVRDGVLDDRCIGTVLNRNVTVDAAGSFAIGNIPVPPGAFRVRFVCRRDGLTERAQTAFVRGVRNAETPLGAVSFDSSSPIPVTLALTSPAPVLTPSAPGAQLVTTGTLVDGTEVDLTLADSGTFYLSSNPAIANVSADGFVTAVSSGTFLVTATHEGVIATIRLAVAFDGDADGDGLPDDYERANAFNPGGFNVARLAGVQAIASSAASGFPATRAIDGNLQTSWFTRVGDAVNRGGSPFLELVFPADQRVAQIRLFGNRRNPNGFAFLAGTFTAFDSMGFLIFDSGERTIVAPPGDLAVPLDLDGVRRVRFTATADQSNTPGLAELEVISRPGGVGLDPFDPADAAADFDVDGLTNLQEFALGTSIYAADTDADGLTDLQETTLGSNPVRADTDNDGLADGAERSPTADTDGDGIRNLLDPDSDGDGL
ncbi:MAG: thrombospondin type 3 repeat-containing protein, partial [Chloroflexi bacterium]|nr:thrombospondin type 3 repeat-containing protein [Chloroflexota bacterium]